MGKSCVSVNPETDSSRSAKILQVGSGTLASKEVCRALYQIHCGNQCATGRVYRHLPAKVELKKSHLGKQSFTGCTLRHPPCQSEFAEALASKHKVVQSRKEFCKISYSREAETCKITYSILSFFVKYRILIK